MEKSDVEAMLPDLLSNVFGAPNVHDHGLALCVATDGGLAAVCVTNDMVRVNGASATGIPPESPFFRELATYGQQYGFGTPVYWEGGGGNFNLLLQSHLPHEILTWESRPSIQYLINTVQAMATIGLQFGQKLQASIGGSLLDPDADADRSFFALHAYQ